MRDMQSVCSRHVLQLPGMPGEAFSKAAALGSMCGAAAALVTMLAACSLGPPNPHRTLA